MPIVLSELETLMLVNDRRASIARFGDGEIGIAVCGAGARGQEYDPMLAKALRKTAATNFKRLIIAIPRIFEHIPPEKHRWARWLQPSRCAMWTDGRVYGSAFISRPDFYGKPFGQDYWDTMRRLWDGRPMLLVRGGEKDPAALYDNAASIETLECPQRNAWSDYHDILAECLTWAAEHKGGIVVAQAGPTATVLAHDLAIRGVQCLDLGKAARFARNEQMESAA